MKKLFLALFFLAFATCANAATCFWVGGTGTWSTTNTASWASSTGGTSGTCAATGGVPKQTADTATFDGSSGGGTVTVDSTMSGTTLLVLAAGAFTGTIDWSVNFVSTANGMTFSSAGTAVEFGGAGSGRVFKLGSGTYNFPNGGIFDFATVTGAGTQSLASATLVFGSTTLSSQQQLNGGGFAYGTVTVNGRTSGQAFQLSGTGTSIATLNLTGPLNFALSGGQSFTVTNLNSVGTIANPILFSDGTITSSLATITTSVTNISYTNFRGISFSSAVTAPNSWGTLGANTNLTATPPSSGGNACIIGGGL